MTPRLVVTFPNTRPTKPVIELSHEAKVKKFRKEYRDRLVGAHLSSLLTNGIGPEDKERLGRLVDVAMRSHRAQFCGLITIEVVEQFLAYDELTETKSVPHYQDLLIFSAHCMFGRPSEPGWFYDAVPRKEGSTLEQRMLEYLHYWKTVVDHGGTTRMWDLTNS